VRVHLKNIRIDMHMPQNLLSFVPSHKCCHRRRNAAHTMSMFLPVCLRCGPQSSAFQNPRSWVAYCAQCWATLTLTQQRACVLRSLQYRRKLRQTLIFPHLPLPPPLVSLILDFLLSDLPSSIAQLPRELGYDELIG
jgi:hypothetical protein